MIGEKLREIRNSKKFSLDVVESLTGISDSRLSKIERGITKNPSLHDISILLKCYGVPLVSFLSQIGYCEPSITSLKNLELLDRFEIEHIQAEIDFILKEKGLNNGI